MLAQTSLTQPELQSLKALLKEQITDLHNNKKYYQEAVKDLYEKANPEDKLNGKFFFDCLNDFRDKVREHKKKIETLEKIQKSVKEELRSSVAIQRTW